MSVKLNFNSQKCLCVCACKQKEYYSSRGDKLLLLLKSRCKNTCIVDKDVQAFLILLDIFGQISDRLQRGKVQFLYHHVAIPTLLPDLISCQAGSSHVPAG